MESKRYFAYGNGQVLASIRETETQIVCVKPIVNIATGDWWLGKNEVRINKKWHKVIGYQYRVGSTATELTEAQFVARIAEFVARQRHDAAVAAQFKAVQNLDTGGYESTEPLRALVKAWRNAQRTHKALQTAKKQC